MKRLSLGRLLLLLTMLCIVTSTYAGYTLARYTTEDTGTDTARIAKWGVEIITSGDLYSGEDLSGNAVVVAPNINNDKGFSFSVSGEPEVAVKVFGTASAQDIYIEEGTYAVMNKLNITSAEEFNSYVDVEYAKAVDDDGNPILDENGEYTYVEAERTSDLYTERDGTYTNVVRYEGSDDPENPIEQPTYYLLSNQVTVDSEYYPVRYTIAGNLINETNKTANEIAQSVMAIFAETTSGKVTTTNEDRVSTYSIIEANADSYATNTDLADKIGSHTVTWVWNTNSGADNILGRMIANKSNIVIKDGGVYKKVNIDTTNGIATFGGNVIASLKTNFAVDITVAQQD